MTWPGFTPAAPPPPVGAATACYYCHKSALQAPGGQPSACADCRRLLDLLRALERGG